MEKLICERRCSISYRDNNVFRKYYKFASETDVIDEVFYATEVKKGGIHCPKVINWGYNAERKMYYSEFEYIEMERIDRHAAKESDIKLALQLIDNMPHCLKNVKDNKEKFRRELTSVISYLPEKKRQEYGKMVQSLLKRPSEVLIHGDYSFENIAWDLQNKKMIVFDFHNSGFGVNGWDKAYFIASLPIQDYFNSLFGEYNELIKIAAALKYGRGIRKKIEIEERKSIYEYWWK